MQVNSRLLVWAGRLLRRAGSPLRIRPTRAARARPPRRLRAPPPPAAADAGRRLGTHRRAGGGSADGARGGGQGRAGSCLAPERVARGACSYRSSRVVDHASRRVSLGTMRRSTTSTFWRRTSRSPRGVPRPMTTAGAIWAVQGRLGGSRAGEQLRARRRQRSAVGHTGAVGHAQRGAAHSHTSE